MLQARNKARMPPHWWLLRNPFLFIGLVSAAARGLMAVLDGASATSWFSLLEWIWQYLGFAYILSANTLAGLMPGLPALIALLLSLAVGLLIYLLLDYIWRRLLSLDS